MKTYRKKVFPLLSGGLWAVFIYLDITMTADSVWVKFAAIALCCITALLGAGTLDGKLVAAAMCLTVGADWFLLVRNDNYFLGVGLFTVVQGLYALRLYRRRGQARSPLLFARAGLLLLCAIAAPSLGLLSAGLFYFSNLCVNAAEAFSLGKVCRVFAWGLLLFICCDICVGAYFLSLFPAVTRVGMWFFYLPSQVLIVLSQEQEMGGLDETTV